MLITVGLAPEGVDCKLKCLVTKVNQKELLGSIEKDGCVVYIHSYSNIQEKHKYHSYLIIIECKAYKNSYMGSCTIERHISLKDAEANSKFIRKLMKYKGLHI